MQEVNNTQYISTGVGVQRNIPHAANTAGPERASKSAHFTTDKSLYCDISMHPVCFTMSVVISFAEFIVRCVCVCMFNPFQYLELRFNQRVRAIASMVFTFSTVLHLPIVVYVPALAFSQVSGVNIHLITPIVSTICIAYTMMGGLKAVVWTDFLQAFVTVGSCLAVLILGIVNVGGLATVFERSHAGGRDDLFNLDPSPFARNTFWTVTVGMTFLWLSQCGINQGMVQKFIALPNIQNARRSLIIFCIGYMSMKALSCFMGLVIYASYYNCDPIRTQREHCTFNSLQSWKYFNVISSVVFQAIDRSDQILPYFVMHATYHLPGLPGLFIAGIFSAAL
ncbi:hypothetical protein PR048_032277, partial [Dryococelus australis]